MVLEECPPPLQTERVAAPEQFGQYGPNLKVGNPCQVHQQSSRAHAQILFLFGVLYDALRRENCYDAALSDFHFTTQYGYKYS